VALARALARNPKAFLFDEPLSAVDAAAREGLRDEFTSLSPKFKCYQFVRYHDRTEALVLADILAVSKMEKSNKSGTPMKCLHILMTLG